ncbi:MAG: hypothetical protein PWQ85_1388 [Geotoga sp.]|jgi:type I restriction-modification system DNA methylase subunit|nr:hypothetical protein [Geotoga sp.]
MQQIIKNLAITTKKLIENDIDNSLELLGFKNGDYFYIEELVSKRDYEYLKETIKNNKDYEKVLNNLVFNYYNAFLALKIVKKKGIFSPTSDTFDNQIKEISHNIEYFKTFENKFLIKIHRETEEKIEKVFEKFDLWEKDDLMGWFYQFYNSDKKDMLSKSQIFTPKWVVKYMVDNSFKLLKDPINAKIIDPACGSGNFLIYIYDKLKDLYITKGYKKVDAIKNILKNNIHGLDLDERAVQIAKFLLTIKAIEDGYTDKIIFNISTPKDSTSTVKIMGSLSPKKITTEDKTKFSEILNKKYDLVIANPPYTDSREYNEKLKDKIKEFYDDYKKNLYTCFIAKNYELLNNNGIIAMITPQTFMFISSYEKTRNLILNKLNIERFVHFGLGGVFDYALVDTALYILTKQHVEKSTFIDLTKIDKNESKKDLLESLSNNSSRVHQVDQNLFKKIPGKKFVYWLDKPFYKIFKEKKLEEFCDIRQGIATGNNKRFLRFQWEIPNEKINFDGKKSTKRWIPYVKGGPHRNWFGNYYWLISFDEKSKSELQNMGNHLPSKQYYFKEGITYTMTTSKGSTFRYLPPNMMFDCKGSSIFPKNKEHIFFFLGLLNSKLTTYILKFLAGSVDLEVGDLKELPVPDLSNKKSLVKSITEQSKKIYNLKKQNMEIFPEELFNKSFISNLFGNNFEEMFNNFIRLKIKVDYDILQEESKLNDLVLELYGLKEEKKTLKKEFKDYLDVDKKENLLKLNYDINKTNAKLSDNIVRVLALEGYNISSIIKSMDKIDFSKNNKIVQEFIFLIANEIITNTTEKNSSILRIDENLFKHLEKYHIDSFITKEYHKKVLQKYLEKVFPKEHYKYFKKTPYIVLLYEPETDFSLFLNTRNITKITYKKIDQEIENHLKRIEDKYGKSDIEKLIFFKKSLKNKFEKYSVEDTYEHSNKFFENFKEFLNY